MQMYVYQLQCIRIYSLSLPSAFTQPNKTGAAGRDA